MESRAITVGERIVEYLEQLPIDELTARDVWPRDATQDGVAAAVGIGRAHVALEMKRLEAKGLVENLLAHVKDAKVRRHVYRAVDESRHAVYTPSGERMPLARAQVRNMEVVVLRCPRCGRESRVALEN